MNNGEELTGNGNGRRKIDRALALSILQRMGETGQPPERGALEVNVGTEEYLDVMRDEYLVPIRDLRRNSTYKVVQADYGGGKTQFLHCLRETAWAEGFVTALVGVSPSSCPFDDLTQIYRSVSQSLEAPPERLDAENDRGIGGVLRDELAKRRKVGGDAAVRAWIRDELARAAIDSHAVRRAAVAFLEAVIEGRSEREALLEAYLRGETVKPAEVQPLGIREMLEPQSAFRFLRSLVQLLNALGVPGLVLLFDEIDRVMSLSVRRRRAIADNMREMIDCCGQSVLPGLVFVYAVPPMFLTDLVPEYPALEQRLRGAKKLSNLSPLSPIIDLEVLPFDAGTLFRRIGMRLLEVHEDAHGAALDVEIQRDNLSVLADEMAKTQLESGTRRTFVKAAIQLLVAQARAGQKRLTLDEIRVLVAGEAAAAPLLEGEDVFQ